MSKEDDQKAMNGAKKVLDEQGVHSVKDALGDEAPKEDSRKLNKQMAEKMILAKLFRDGIFVVNEEEKTVDVYAYRSTLIERYKEESYEHIRSIIDRTVIGLKQAGYEVTVHRVIGG